MKNRLLTLVLSWCFAFGILSPSTLYAQTPSTPSVRSNKTHGCADGSQAITLTNDSIGLSTYSATSSTLQTNLTGGSVTYTLTNVPQVPSSSATLTVYYRGDLNSSTEYINYYGEGASYIGRSNATSQCSSVYGSKTFTISSTNIKNWAADGTISIVADASSDVNNLTACGYAFQGYIKLSYDHGAYTTYWFIGSCGTSTTAIDSGASITVSPSVTTKYYAVNYDNSYSLCDSITINVNPLPTVLATAARDTICSGDTVQLSASGASSYVWSPSADLTQSTISNPIADPSVSTAFQVTGTDSHGCTGKDTVTVVTQSNPTVLVNPTLPTCVGDSDGMLVAVASGGSSPYSFAWSTGVTKDTLGSLKQGTYGLTVTDQNSCQDSLNYVLNNPTPPPTVMVSASATSICANSNQSVNLNLTYSGSGSQNYSYTTGIQSSNGAGPNFTFNFPVNTPPAVQSATLTVYYRGDLDASSEYINYYGEGSTYLGRSNSTSQCPSGYSSKSFTISAAQLSQWASDGTVSILADATFDVGYCTLSEYMKLTFNYSSTKTYLFSSSCSQNVSSAIDSGYSFTISPTQTNTYHVSTFDGTCWGNCDAITIQVDTLPVVSISALKDTICQLDSTTLTGKGATTYVWSGSSDLSSTVGSSVFAYPMTSSQIKVVGTDGNGCVGSDSMVVTVNPVPIFSYTTEQPKCNGLSDGKIIPSASGATAPYSYSWSNGSQQDTLQPVAAGSYTVTVTDNLGCDKSFPAILTEPTAIQVAFTDTQPSCNGFTDGSLRASASGGTGNNYGYTWSNSQTGPWIGGLTAQLYTVTVSDSLNCLDTFSFTLGQPDTVPDPNLTYAKSTLCNNFDSVTISTSGPGVAGNQWTQTTSIQSSFSAGPNFTFNFTNVPQNIVGNATLTVYYRGDLDATSEYIDYYGEGSTYLGRSNRTSQCPSGYSSKSFTLTEAQVKSWAQNGVVSIFADASSNVGYCNTSEYMRLTFTQSGVGTYWFTSACPTTYGQISTAIDSVSSKTIYSGMGLTYHVVNTKDGCLSKCETVNLSSLTSPTVQLTTNTDTICQGDTASFTASGASTYLWTGTRMSQTTGSSNQAYPLATSNYILKGTATNGCTDYDTTSLYVRTVTGVSLTSTPAKCYGFSDGKIQANVPSTGSYSYQWNNAATTQINNNLTAGNYSVTVTDQHGCRDTLNGVVTQPTPINTTITPNAPTCYNSQDGYLSANATGGTSPYTYSWSNGSNLWFNNNLNSGTYFLTVTDGKGCTQVDTAVLGAPSSITAIDSVSAPITSFCAGSQSSLSMTAHTNLGTGNSYLQTTTVRSSSAAGPNFTFTFTNVPASVSSSATLTLYYRGDLDASSEYINVYGEGNTYLGRSNSTSQCSSGYSSKNFTISQANMQSWSSDGKIVINTDASANVGYCTTYEYMRLSFNYGEKVYWFTSGCGSSLSAAIDSGTVLNRVPTQTTTYYVRKQFSNCWSNCDSITIQVNSNPSVQIATDSVEFCSGQSAKLTASGGSTYQWSPSTGLNSSTGSSVQASPSSSRWYTVTGSSPNSCTGTDSVYVTRNTTPSASFASIPVVCGTTTPVTLTQGSASPAGGTGVYSGTGVTGNSFDPVSAGNGTHSLSYIYTLNTGCADTATTNVVVTPKPTATFASISPVCVNGNIVTLNQGGGSPSGGTGTYFGTGVNNSQFNPGTAGSGSHSLGYIYELASNCKDTAYRSVTVHSAPTVSLTPLGSVCIDTGLIVLSGGSPSNGSYSGTGVVGSSFNPLSAGSGVHTITYSYTNANNCTDSSSQLIQVNALPSVSFSTPAGVCKNASPVTLTTGFPSGGAYSGVYVSNGKFDPSSASTGKYTLQYDYTDSKGCKNSDTAQIEVLAVPNATLAAFSDLCKSTSAVALTGGSPASGNYFGNFVSQNLFTPSTPGAYSIGYTYQNTQGCSDTAYATLTVNNLPTVTLGSFSAVCADASPFVLSGGSPVGGSYTGTGVGSGSFDPASSGTGTHAITYTYTDANQCTNTASQNQIVHALPTVNLPALSAVCDSAPSFTLNTGTPAGGSYTGTGVSSGSFDPAGAGVGSHLLTYSYTDGNQCTNTDTSSQVVHALPVVSFASLNNICANAGAMALSGGSPAGGNYSGSGVASGQFTPSTAGNFTLTYTFSNAQQCTDSAHQTITVDTVPIVSLPALSDVCIDTGVINLPGGTPTGGSYSGTGVSGSNFDPAMAGSGNHTVTYLFTDGNQCSDSASQTQVVNALPVVGLSVPSSICGNDSTLVFNGGTPTGGSYSGPNVSNGQFDPSQTSSGSHTITYTYTDNKGCTNSDSSAMQVDTVPVVTLAALSGSCHLGPAFALSGGNPAGGQYSGPQVSTNQFDPSQVGQFPIVYTYTDGEGCSDSATQNQTVHALPVVTLAAQNAVCANAAPYALAGGQPTGGSYSGVAVNGGTDFDPSLGTPGSQEAITYHYTDANNCTDSAHATVQVDTVPVVTLAAQPTSCENDGILTLVSGNPSGGQFAGNFVTPVGEFYPDSSGGGFHPVFYFFTDGNGCSDTAQQNVEIFGAPKFDLGNDTTICGDDLFTMTTGLSYGQHLWSNGDTNNSLSINGSGTFWVSVTDSNSCFYADTIQVGYEPICLSVYDPLVVGDHVNYYPNPNDGRFTVRIEGITEALQLRVLSLSGQEVMHLDLEAAQGLRETSIDLGDVAPGTYVIILSNGRLQRMDRIQIGW